MFLCVYYALLCVPLLSKIGIFVCVIVMLLCRNSGASCRWFCRFNYSVDYPLMVGIAADVHL